jgi:hypothetical protein
MSAVKTHGWGENWSSIESFQGAVLQKAGWPKFNATGNIREYMEFNSGMSLTNLVLETKKFLKSCGIIACLRN